MDAVVAVSSKLVVGRLELSEVDVVKNLEKCRGDDQSVVLRSFKQLCLDDILRVGGPRKEHLMCSRACCSINVKASYKGRRPKFDAHMTQRLLFHFTFRIPILATVIELSIMREWTQTLP